MAEKLTIPFARFTLAIIYIWFGALKILELSPASPLVGSLLEKTLPFITLEQFILYLGIFEVVIGLLFLIPKLTKLAAALFSFHMLLAAAPLLFLPSITWQALLVPTLEGQYIVKNLALIGLVLAILRDRQR